MKRYQHFIIGTFLFTLLPGVTFAGPAVCPEPPEMIDILVEKDWISGIALGNYEACKNARASQIESTITDFVCPSGDFSIADRPHTDEILAYQIAVATVFQAIDTNAMQYAKNLQCNRDTDPIKWQQTIKIFTDANTGYAKQYNATCDISYITSLLNSMWVGGQFTFDVIQTSDTFPQYCEYLAGRKIDALHNLWILLMSNWVGKWFQNDKDIFLDTVKTKYSGLLDKMSAYLRIVGRAVAKLDRYIKNPIN